MLNNCLPALGCRHYLSSLNRWGNSGHERKFTALDTKWKWCNSNLGLSDFGNRCLTSNVSVMFKKKKKKLPIGLTTCLKLGPYSLSANMILSNVCYRNNMILSNCFFSQKLKLTLERWIRDSAVSSWARVMKNWLQCDWSTCITLK